MAEAVRIAQNNGINVPDDVLFVPVDHLPPEETASYGAWKGDREWETWESFYTKSGKIVVSFNERYLSSDEAITAIVAHELHEIESLRTLFKSRHGRMPFKQLYELINPNGKLHMAAWDAADRIVKQLRAQQQEGR